MKLIILKIKPRVWNKQKRYLEYYIYYNNITCIICIWKVIIYIWNTMFRGAFRILLIELFWKIRVQLSQSCRATTMRQLIFGLWCPIQHARTCSKLTIEIPDIVSDVILVSLLLALNVFHTFSCVSVVEFEQLYKCQPESS